MVDQNNQVRGNKFIAGVESRGGSRFFMGADPRTKEAGQTQSANATAAEIDRAVQAALVAFEQTRHFSPSWLADFLDVVAEEIDALGENLLLTADSETGLGIPRLTGERGRTTGQLRKFGELLREGSYVEAIIDSAQSQRQPTPRPAIRRMLKPLGPVAVFSASNFPFAFSVAGGDTASAFAAGCPVIVKAHPGHPATSELVAHAINRAIVRLGFPAGFFSLLQGDTIEVGQTLVTHPGVAAVGFTGSLRAGRAIFDAAAARPTPIPVYAEMGSTNPVVILPGVLAADGPGLVTNLVGSLTLGSGQFCTNPGLVFVVAGDETEAFIAEVAKRMGAEKPGVLLNAQIETGLAQTVATTLGEAEIELLTGGHVVPGDGFCFSNTVLRTTATAFAANPRLQIEHFGPVTLFVVAPSVADLLMALAALHGNLTGTIHAADSEHALAAQVMTCLDEKVGRLLWNGFPTGVEVCYAMQHGGPYPATTAPATTSVGMTAIKRFLRPVAYQNVPDHLLPPALQDANPLHIWRIVDDEWTQDPLP